MNQGIHKTKIICAQEWYKSKLNSDAKFKTITFLIKNDPMDINRIWNHYISDINGLFLEGNFQQGKS